MDERDIGKLMKHGGDVFVVPKQEEPFKWDSDTGECISCKDGWGNYMLQGCRYHESDDVKHIMIQESPNALRSTLKYNTWTSICVSREKNLRIKVDVEPLENEDE